MVGLIDLEGADYIWLANATLVYRKLGGHPAARRETKRCAIGELEGQFLLMLGVTGNFRRRDDFVGQLWDVVIFHG